MSLFIRGTLQILFNRFWNRIGWQADSYHLGWNVRHRKNLPNWKSTRMWNAGLLTMLSWRMLVQMLLPMLIMLTKATVMLMFWNHNQLWPPEILLSTIITSRCATIHDREYVFLFEFPSDLWKLFQHIVRNRTKNRGNSTTNIRVKSTEHQSIRSPTLYRIHSKLQVSNHWPTITHLRYRVYDCIHHPRIRTGLSSTAKNLNHPPTVNHHSARTTKAVT